MQGEINLQFDRGMLAIYNAIVYLDARMEPAYHEVEQTAYLRLRRCIRADSYDLADHSHAEFESPAFMVIHMVFRSC